VPRRTSAHRSSDVELGRGNDLDEPDFEHDFDRVDYDVTEFDERAGTLGLHTVRGTVKAEPRETLLPPELFKRFANDAFWRDSQRIPAGLQVV
jgi:sulfotransferase